MQNKITFYITIRINYTKSIANYIMINIRFQNYTSCDLHEEKAVVHKIKKIIR